MLLEFVGLFILLTVIIAGILILPVAFIAFIVGGGK